MSAQSISSALLAAAPEVMETMFFSEALVSEAPAENEAPVVRAIVAFSGEPHGNLSAEVDEPAARRLAADFVGAMEPDELSPKQVEEVVGELANMLCGAMLTALHTDRIFELATPVVSHATPTKHRTAVADSYFDLGDGGLRIAVDVGAQS